MEGGRLQLHHIFSYHNRFDKSYYEAAIVKMTKLQQIGHITLPVLRPHNLTMLAMRYHADFGLFYQVLRSSALYPTTNTIDTYVYRGLLQLGNISMASAAGVYQSLVGFVLVLSSNLLVRKIDRESALI